MTSHQRQVKRIAALYLARYQFLPIDPFEMAIDLRQRLINFFRVHGAEKVKGSMNVQPERGLQGFRMEVRVTADHVENVVEITYAQASDKATILTHHQNVESGKAQMDLSLTTSAAQLQQVLLRLKALFPHAGHRAE